MGEKVEAIPADVAERSGEEWHLLETPDGVQHELMVNERDGYYRRPDDGTKSRLGLTEDQRIILDFALATEGQTFRPDDVYQELIGPGSPKSRFHEAVSDRETGLIVKLELAAGTPLWVRDFKDHRIAGPPGVRQFAESEEPINTNELFSDRDAAIVRALVSALQDGPLDENQIVNAVRKPLESLGVDLGSRPLQVIKGVIHKINNLGTDSPIVIGEYGKRAKSKYIWDIKEEFKAPKQPEFDSPLEEFVYGQLLTGSDTVTPFMIFERLPNQLRLASAKQTVALIRKIIESGVDSKALPYRRIEILRGQSVSEAYRVNEQPSEPWRIAGKFDIQMSGGYRIVTTPIQKRLLNILKLELDNLDVRPEGSAVIVDALIKRIFGGRDWKRENFAEAREEVYKAIEDLNKSAGSTLIRRETLFGLRDNRIRRRDAISFGAGYTSSVDRDEIDRAMKS